MELKPEFYHGYPVESIEPNEIKLSGGVSITSYGNPFNARDVPKGMEVVKTIYSEDSIHMVLAVVQRYRSPGEPDKVVMNDEWRVVLTPGQFRITDTQRNIIWPSADAVEIGGILLKDNILSLPVEQMAEGPNEEWHEFEKVKEDEVEPKPKPKAKPQPKKRRKE